MTTQTTFEEYFNFRIDRAQALTPGKKLALTHQLLEEAQQGRVPVGRDQVAQLPVESRSVKAVLAGEPVSIGKARMQATGSATTMLDKMQGLPHGARLGIMVGLLIGLSVIGFFVLNMLFGRGDSAQAREEAQPTQTVSEIPVTPSGSVVLSDTDPGRKGSDPASIQIGETSFVLGRGEVDDGVWKPTQAEWLEGTQVRRVIAIPLSALESPIRLEDILRIRIRSGISVPYRVVEITEVQRTQIEVLSSLEPSLVVILFDDTAPSSRQVVIAKLALSEMEIAEEREENTYLVNGPVGEINLRERPYGAVVGVLKNGTSVAVQTDVEPVNDGGYKWVRIETSYGAAGWVASMYLTELPQ